MATSAPAGENIQIDITENGTTTLATAGKYCDRNIDVNVAVPGKATQFTNLYDPANVQVKTLLSASSSGITYSSDNQVNCIKIPFHHTKNQAVVLRMRGIGTVRDRYRCAVLASDGETRVNHYDFVEGSYFDMSYDEYGDVMITFKGNIITTYEWYYFAFNFQYPGLNSNATAQIGPIITINEPIGNGGHAG